ncbi:MAG: cell division ATP-binding protein FtsE [Rhodospirillaceae bacterium]|nr:cell division ATP-binding protein FtsE [Rhodospirillaceae bacterium]
MLRFENVEVCYSGKKPILRELYFHLEPHSFHFLTGKSGAGKSSLLKTIYLDLAPSRGRITLFGRDVSSLKAKEIPNIRRRMGIVFQDFRLIENLTVSDNVALPLRIFGTKESVVRRHVPELLEWVGLGNCLKDFPRALSGGQKQRVAIARAVIARPALLIADEPTGNVDDVIAERLMYLFEELYRAGTNVLIATHNETLVQKFNYPVLRIENGRLTV